MTKLRSSLTEVASQMSFGSWKQNNIKLEKSYPIETHTVCICHSMVDFTRCPNQSLSATWWGEASIRATNSWNYATLTLQRLQQPSDLGKNYMGGSVNGGTPIAGWFFRGKIRLKWMMTGYPDIRNAHMAESEQWPNYTFPSASVVFSAWMSIQHHGCQWLHRTP